MYTAVYTEVKRRKITIRGKVHLGLL